MYRNISLDLFINLCVFISCQILTVEFVCLDAQSQSPQSTFINTPSLPAFPHPYHFLFTAFSILSSPASSSHSLFTHLAICRSPRGSVCISLLSSLSISYRYFLPDRNVGSGMNLLTYLAFQTFVFIFRFKWMRLEFHKASVL